MANAIPSVDHQVKVRLTERGVRLTTNRRAVVEALVKASGPLGASELSAELTTVPLSSLYRTLSVLDEAGVISLHHGAGGLTRFELAEWLRGHHHHLICHGCGAVEDVELDSDAEQALHALAIHVAGASDYTADGHSLEIEGQCGRCRHA